MINYTILGSDFLGHNYPSCTGAVWKVSLHKNTRGPGGWQAEHELASCPCGKKGQPRTGCIKPDIASKSREVSITSYSHMQHLLNHIWSTLSSLGLSSIRQIVTHSGRGQMRWSGGWHMVCRRGWELGLSHLKRRRLKGDPTAVVS